MAVKLAPLSIAKDVEQQRSWEGISTPYDLLIYFSKFASVDIGSLQSLDEVEVSSIEPENKTKIWIKTGNPVAIGVPIGSSYKMFYQYPPNVPFLWIGDTDSVPSYLTLVSDSDLEDYEITKPNKSKANYVVLFV